MDYSCKLFSAESFRQKKLLLYCHIRYRLSVEAGEKITNNYQGHGFTQDYSHIELDFSNSYATSQLPD